MLVHSHARTLPVYTIEQVRELDRRAIQEYGIPGYALMTAAATALFEAICQYYPETRSVCIVCGAGNNAGDGYVLARLAKAAQWQVDVIAVVDPIKLQADAQSAYQDYLAIGGQVAFFNESLPLADVLVDAVLGTGLTRELDGVFLAAVKLINQYANPVVAVDIPSGLNGNTGQAMGAAVVADLTVSFIGLKQGLFTGQARDYVGQLVFKDLALPLALTSQIQAPMQTLSVELLKQNLPKRARSAHKGTFGHVLLVGGYQGMSGAVRLAAEAALRTGSGLVSVATHASHAAWLNLSRPELMVHSVESAAQLNDLALGKSATGIGTGLSQTPWAKVLWQQTLELDLPRVLDADALNLLAVAPYFCDSWILTPHPAEAARLLACSTQTIESDRVAAVQALQKKYGGVIVLKGAGTLVADQRKLYVCLAGNAGMASAGMGDVLTGIITSLLGQGLSLTTAACVGVLVHALAADAAAANGERGLIASDVIAKLREYVNP